MTCPDCKIEMRFVATLTEGDEEGRFVDRLYQCENCKLIEVEKR